MDLNFCAKLCGLDLTLGEGDITGFCCDMIELGSDIFSVNCLLSSAVLVSGRSDAE